MPKRNKDGKDFLSDEEREEFQRRLKDYRAMYGLTLKQAGERAGLAFTWIHKLENHKLIDPSLSTLLKLSKSYKCKISNLVGK